MNVYQFSIGPGTPVHEHNLILPEGYDDAQLLIVARALVMSSLSRLFAARREASEFAGPQYRYPQAVPAVWRPDLFPQYNAFYRRVTRTPPQVERVGDPTSLFLSFDLRPPVLPHVPYNGGSAPVPTPHPDAPDERFLLADLTAGTTRPEIEPVPLADVLERSAKRVLTEAEVPYI
ncbi:MAG: hypothetical protein DI640_13155 [Sphingomonas taxi]|uniref:Uncharacterized protein n=1 Tax=Sphingomonas taxi TaxID=1549858 RepID=A0A2W4YRZ5_9SPHN|nr:MAG: hypothetical protein DI640_13155 [Sphingomonas taxi]